MSSKQARDDALAANVLYLSNRRCRVVIPDPSREVIRCSKCQRYGHRKKFCSEKTAVACGICASNHETEFCPPASRNSPKCVNCIERKLENHFHVAGDPSCPAQIRAVSHCRRIYAL